MRPVPNELHGRVFTPAEAARYGVTPRMLQGARFAQVFLGVWRTSATAETEELRIRAALKILPGDAALSHLSAVRWRGLDVGTSVPLHFSTASAVHVEREGLVVHRRQARLRPQLLRGVPVLDGARTFVDVATDVGDRALLRIGDWLVRHGHVDLLELRAFAIAEHLDGVQRARRVAPLVRERVDSVRESDVRWIIHASGLPMPEPNVPILDAQGVHVANGDLVYCVHRVLIEHDGWHHERDAVQRQRDHLRREMLEALGWRVIVITVEDFEDERQIAWRVFNALRERGYRGPSPRFGR
ncbi:DUF559 domain-containing protein [Aeromicrobium wangtongii]|uniref:DUF559 domain-containing protein n=1 Tax=Aeromicrobium wangtongii TaxID=2969247 RepID=UPI002018159D|nr:DUF559 domain-containing protein [Aeromicrobium wangtongii]MCL3817363.1 endonuclease domain-containing protein [Aeromicrobium wangtongii]